MIMRMLVDAKWLRFIISVHAFFAFFMGVLFVVWGGDFTSPPWFFVFSVPGGHTTWGVPLLVAGGLFMLGLDWGSKWPRFAGGLLSGLIYLGVGAMLALAPIFANTAFNGSWGMWLFSGAMSIGLAFLMKEMSTFIGKNHR